jgi:alkylated DNA nucleotide flippase Atl1
MVSKVSVLDEMRQLQSSKPRGAKCTLGQLTKMLGADDAQAVGEAMADQMIDSNTISVWLSGRGYQIKRHTVARHRRKECRCDE